MGTLQVSPLSVSPVNTVRGKALAYFAWFALAFMVLVVLWGAVVRATSSGAGCGNHWPLCNGDFFPHHPRLATVIEFTHRSMTGVLTAIIALLAAWTLLTCKRPHPARKAVGWVVLLLITEALLGAVLVKGGYVEGNTSTARVIVQCVHFTNTMALLAALTLTAWWLAVWTPQSTAVESASTNRRAKLLAVSALVVTIVVGATGSVAALADTLFPSPSLRAAFAQDFSAAAPLLVRMRWLHPASAVLSVVLACLLALALRNAAAARAVLLLSALQVLLGCVDVLLLAPVWMQIEHLLGADLFWIALVVLCSEALLFTQQPHRAAGR